jgi:hypothetical protein
MRGEKKREGRERKLRLCRDGDVGRLRFWGKMRASGQWSGATVLGEEGMVGGRRV